MGKAFITAARWLAPLSAILAPRRHNPATLNMAERAEQAAALTSRHPEVVSGARLAAQSLVGIDLQEMPSSPTLEARSDPGRAPATLHVHPAPATRPLRVLRIRESAPHPRQAGRLVISGRMADVCAELERLSAAHPGLVH